MDHFCLILFLFLINMQLPFALVQNHSTHTLLGLYYSNNEFDLNMTNINRMEKWLGGGKKGFKHSILQFFTGWCPAVSSTLDWYTTVTVRSHLHTFWSSGSVPLMTWQPSCYDQSLKSQSSISKSLKSPDDFLVRIGSGKHDSYIYKMIEEIKDFLAGADGIYGNHDDRRMYMRLGHEMNGNWYQWSVALNKRITVADYTKMWIHVRKLFDEQLSTTVIDGAFSVVDMSERIQWIWCPNSLDVGPVKAEAYYPGDSYVDWLGMDVHNLHGVSLEASGLMLPMLQRFEKLSPNKPVGVPEFGTEYNYWYGLGAKENWLKDFFDQVNKYGISMAVLFNKDLYSVYGSSRNSPVIHEYVDMVRRQVNLIHTDMSEGQRNAKLIANKAFKGYVSNQWSLKKEKQEEDASGKAWLHQLIVFAIIVCLLGISWYCYQRLLQQLSHRQSRSAKGDYRVIAEGDETSHSKG